MKFHYLECFIAVAQYLNFTEAAKHLYIAQSAVSHNISELEKELDIKLLYRDKQTVMLTGAGEIFLKEALKITSMTREATSRTQKIKSGAIGNLNIGFTFVKIIDYLVDELKEFSKNNPEIDISYNSYDSITMSKMLDNNELDIGFARLITVSKKNKKNWKPLYRDQLYLVFPAGHKKTNMDKIKLQEVSDEIFMLMKREINPGMFDCISQLCINCGFTPKIVDHANDLSTQILLARMGKGIIILPESFIHSIPKDLVPIPIDNENSYHEIGVVWSKDNGNPTVPIFLEELKLMK